MHTHAPTKHAGICLRDLRARQKVSQLDLALRVGVSQRHLSCIETGKASASKEMLLALLEGLDAPLNERNETLVAAGFAPLFGSRPIDHREMDTINEVIDLMLTAQHAAPAMVLDSEWNLVKFNPTLVTRFKSTAGELRFISTFTSFGAPLDITAASLRIEHLFPADEATRKAFS
jgi:transcriptional regulator with XRE-family HTH domain